MDAECWPGHRGVWRLLSPDHLTVFYMLQSETRRFPCPREKDTDSKSPTKKKAQTFANCYGVCEGPGATLTRSLFAKHFLTGQPLTYCLALYSVAMAAVAATVICFDGLYLFVIRTEQKPDKASVCERQTH